jgi:glyoxylate/succinic semialdehyde reductase
MMVSFSEGLLLSEKVGLDPNTLVEVILGNETEII